MSLQSSLLTWPKGAASGASHASRVSPRSGFRTASARIDHNVIIAALLFLALPETEGLLRSLLNCSEKVAHEQLDSLACSTVDFGPTSVQFERVVAPRASV